MDNVGAEHRSPSRSHSERALLGLAQVTTRRLWFPIGLHVAWRWFGYTMLRYLASLQAVPRDVYDAASIDGAGGGKQFVTSRSRRCDR